MQRRTIEAIDLVSDGIIVQFSGGLRCYFPASFLLDHVQSGANQVLLDHDPTPAPQWDAEALEALCSPDAFQKARVC